MRQRFSILVIGAILLLVIISIVFSPIIKGAVLTITRPVTAYIYEKSSVARHWTLVLRDLKNLPKENEELTFRISDLLAQNTQLKEVEHENQLLKDELKINAAKPERRIIEAQVVSKNVFSFLDSLVINKGTEEGASIGQAVTLNGSLVGKIISTTPHESSVQLITSAEAITQAQLQNSRVNGVVRGGIQGLVLEFIPQDTVIAPGENIITSGLGNDLRSGILIGTVINVVSRKSDIYQTVNIKPAVKLTTIDTVFIERNK